MRSLSALVACRLAFVAAGIGSDFRPSAQRHLFAVCVGGGELFRRGIVVVPLFECGERVEVAVGVAAAAVSHPRHHVQAGEAVRAGGVLL